MRAPSGWLLLTAGAIAVASCSRPATQLLAVVETDASQSTYGCVRIEAIRLPRATPQVGGTLGLRTPEQITLPFSTGITPPDGDPARRVEVVAELRVDGCDERTSTEDAPRIRRVVRTGFLAEQTLRLPIFLGDRCRDVACAAEESCQPTSGACEPIMEIDPTTLAPARPGEELGDADAGPPGDDAGVPCVPGEEAGSSRNGVLSSFGLGQASENGRTIRASLAGDVVSVFDPAWVNVGGSVGGATVSGPTAAALLADGSFGAYTYTQSPSALRVRVFAWGEGTNLEARLTGPCPSTLCIAALGGVSGDFVVLAGTSPLVLHQVTPLAVVTAGTAVTTVASTFGAVRSARIGVLVTYASGGACTLEHWRTISGPSDATSVPDCARLDMAELADDRVAIAWASAAGRIEAGVLGPTLASMTPLGTLDAAQLTTEPVEVRPNATGFRVSWVDDGGAPALRSVRFDAAGTPAPAECAASAGHTLAEYRMFHAGRSAAGSTLEWPHANAFFEAQLSD